MSEVSERGPLGDHAAVASYVASMSAELARLCETHGLHTLAYILEMARLEAKSLAEDPLSSGRLSARDRGT